MKKVNKPIRQLPTEAGPYGPWDMYPEVRKAKQKEWADKAAAREKVTAVNA
jgi:hypothetical protein